MPFELNILGSSSAVPTKDRNQTALVLDLGYQSVLFDAGEGVQKQFIIRNLKPHKIKYVVISHLHPDHFIGLIGLLCSWGLMGRHHKLTIIAPDGLQEIINLQLNTSGIKLSFEVEFIIPPIANNALVLENEHFSIKSYILSHRVKCFGYVLTEKAHERKLLPEMLEGKEIPYKAFPVLKSGKNYVTENGIELNYLDYTDDPPKSRSFAYFTDTTVKMDLAKYLKGVDLLYHDSTFMCDFEQKAKETGHSTTCQAAEFAKAAGVKKLLLGHFSSRYGNLSPLENEAKPIFAESYLAIEGLKFEVNNQ